MKTKKNHTSHRVTRHGRGPRDPILEERFPDAIEDLVARASRGDYYGIWAVHFFFRRTIVEVLDSVLSPHIDEEEEVYDSVLLALLGGRAPYSRDQGPPIEWLRNVIRVCAEQHKALREMNQKAWVRCGA